jgi:hypothetical protein
MNIKYMYRHPDNFRPVSFTVSAWSLCYELILPAERNERERERERDKQMAQERSTQRINNSDPITSKSELLLRQNSVTAHANQSQDRRLASDHCATEIHQPKSAVRPTLQLITATALST